jgi:hypothetical protein
MDRQASAVDGWHVCDREESTVADMAGAASTDEAAPPPPPPRMRGHLAAAGDDDGGDDAVVVAVAEERAVKRRPLKGTNIYFEAASPRDIVLLSAVENGMAVVHKREKADIIWLEATPYSPAEIRNNLEPHQRVNSLPGLKTCASKCEFSNLTSRLARLFPGEFEFVPKTFALPWQTAELAAHAARAHKDQVYIVKPDGGCGGDGLYLTNNVADLRHAECVVQEYVADALLLGDLKFDLRLYVVVTSVHPLRYYLHREGLARCAVEPYHKPCKANFHKINMHLTNYSINKFATAFVPNTEPDADEGTTKRSVSTAFRQLRAQHGARFDEEALWGKIAAIVGKTMACVAPHILATAGDVPGETAYLKRCFQLIGFDVFVDDDMTPHLLEINNHPSLQTDAPVDVFVKGKVLKPMTRMIAQDAVAFKSAGRKRFAQPAEDRALAWEELHCGADFMAYTDNAALTAKFTAPFLQLMAVFIQACGGAASRKYDEMSAMRFLRLMRKVGLVGARLPSCDVDLLFIKRSKRTGRNFFTFFDFVDAVLLDVGDKVAPDTPPNSLARLRQMTAILQGGDEE